MDLALAIWQIDPQAEYLLDRAHVDPDHPQEIVEWRGPGPQPTEEELAAAWAAYQDPATRRRDPGQAEREADLALIRDAAAADARFAALARHLGVPLGG